MPGMACSPDSDAAVLFVRLSALGDAVFALPALRALRELVPGARVTWLAEDRIADLLADHPDVDELLVFPRRQWRERRGLRRLAAVGPLRRHWRAVRAAGPFALAFDFQGNLKSGLHLGRARAARKIGFDRAATKEGAWRFASEHAADPGRVHRVERDLALVRAVGFGGRTPAARGWPLPESARDAVEAELSGHTAGARPLVLLHTGVTHYGRDKEWPRDRWLALARELDALGCDVRLLWSEADETAVRALAAVTPAALAPATPSLAHLMALTDHADAVVGTDSGPVHIAAHRGTPVVGLYGPTDPVRYAPYGPRVRVLYALEEGAEPPPRDRSGPSPLMGRITVEQVRAAVEEQLAPRTESG